MKIAVGVSGGVDSSVAALLLRDEGHDVSGIMMKLCREPSAGGGRKSSCYGPGEGQDIQAAQDVCSRLSIPFHLFDCSREYEEAVLRYFRDEYLAGRTPNPCVRCNSLVKFGFLPDAARRSGLAFDRFATGHYARLDYDPVSKRHLLKTAVDKRKDQTYFLYRLTQEQLAAAVFPLGDRLKSRVRQIARDEGLPVHDHPESQDFYAGDWNELVRQPEAEGDIVDGRGTVLGRHKGTWNYTIGQRKGLGIANPVPLYVIAIDAARNRLVVGPAEETFRASCIAGDCAWIAVERPAEPLDVLVKIRSASRPAPAVVSPLQAGRALVTFAAPQSAVTPGQSAVFYRGEVVVGGGIIESAA